MLLSKKGAELYNGRFGGFSLNDDTYDDGSKIEIPPEYEAIEIVFVETQNSIVIIASPEDVRNATRSYEESWEGASINVVEAGDLVKVTLSDPLLEEGKFRPLSLWELLERDANTKPYRRLDDCPWTAVSKITD